MRAHIGLSFCVESINYASFFKQDQTLVLDRLGALPYPFAYQEVELFSENNINSLTRLIKNEIISDSIEDGEISISIESNLATLKRIVLPDNLNKDEEQEHIFWDLSQTLIDPVDDYLFFKTVNCFQSGAYKDFLAVAIRKNTIKYFQELCSKLELNLADVSVNQLVAEITLQNVLQDKTEGFIALFKVGASRLESTYLWNGNFYSSHYDRIAESPHTENYNETLLNTINSKIKQMENLFAQFLQDQIKLNRIFLYGDAVDDDLIKILQKNISVVVFRLNPLQNIEKSPQLEKILPSIKDPTKYVEPIGIVLDQ